MTNPTTFFNWQMPENTSLVTDLPADFEVFGQAVDTDFQDLLGGTTGQVLSKTSGTDLDFTWVDPTAGDITGVTAGTGISGGGTSGTVTVTNSMATAIDAKGDLIAGTADDTFSALAVGADGTVLTADSAEATGLKWAAVAGGMTLLSTTTLSGASTTISSISQDYTNLYIVGKGLNQGANASYFFRLNGNDTAADYSSHILFCTVSGSPVVDFVDDNNGAFGQLGTRTSWNGQGYFQMTINRYTETENKLISSDFRVHLASSPDVKRSFVGLTAFNSTTAISSIKFVAGSGSHDGTVYIYGVS
jgi:hypothetical protein